MTTAWPSGVIMLPLEKWKTKFSLPWNENWWRTTGKSELSNDHHTSTYYVLQTSLQRKGHIATGVGKCTTAGTDGFAFNLLRHGGELSITGQVRVSAQKGPNRPIALSASKKRLLYVAYLVRGTLHVLKRGSFSGCKCRMSHIQLTQ